MTNEKALQMLTVLDKHLDRAWDKLQQHKSPERDAGLRRLIDTLMTSIKKIAHYAYPEGLPDDLDHKLFFMGCILNPDPNF